MKGFCGCCAFLGPPWVAVGFLREFDFHVLLTSCSESILKGGGSVFKFGDCVNGGGGGEEC